MEASGVVFRPVQYIPGNGMDRTSFLRSSALGLAVSSGNAVACGDLRLLGSRRSRTRKSIGFSKSWIMFSDNAHLEYYSGFTMPAISCGCGKEEKVTEKEKNKTAKRKTKKRLKLLKSLSRDLSLFSEMDFGLDHQNNGLVDQVRGNMISSATELLLGQLEGLRTEEKELKKKKKQEKALLEAARMQNRMVLEESSTSSSSESSSNSDGECGDVVDMSCLKSEVVVEVSTPVIDVPLTEGPEPINIMPDVRLTLPVPGIQSQERKNTAELPPVTQGATFTSIVPSRVTQLEETVAKEATGKKKIEVCMGGKCKKSGGELLLEEFKKVLGADGDGEAAAVGSCKCMGKCRDGPNVRVVSCSSEAQGVADDSVRNPTNTVCIGVGLEDVGLIVANYFGVMYQGVVGPAP